eukprot:GHVP01053852.1.p1 GENE.GHVP01053852.1~~GHVP01053852.1.p1  ORF type:complete len:842 (+),score=185.95 GHVP01053852.1:22-2526(+)
MEIETKSFKYEVDVINYIQEVGDRYVAEARAKRDSTINAPKNQFDILHNMTFTGTFTDQIGAATQLIAHKPNENFYLLRYLIGFMQQVSKKRRLVSAITAFRDVMLKEFLKKDRPLHFFRKNITLQTLFTRESNHKFVIQMTEEVKQKITEIFVEDTVKEEYANFIQIVAISSQDPTMFVKKTVVGVIRDLLIASPEQKSALMTILVRQCRSSESNLENFHSLKKEFASVIYKRREYGVDAIKIFADFLKEPMNEVRTSTNALSVIAGFPILELETARTLLKVLLELVHYIFDPNKKKKLEWKFKHGKKKRVGGEAKIKFSSLNGAGLGEKANKFVFLVIRGLEKANSKVEMKDLFVEYNEDILKTLYRCAYTTTSPASRIRLTAFLCDLSSRIKENHERSCNLLYFDLGQTSTLNSRYFSSIIHLYIKKIEENLQLEPDTSLPLAYFKKALQSGLQIPNVSSLLALMLRSVYRINCTDQLLGCQKTLLQGGDPKESALYKIESRNPKYAKAEFSHFWELRFAARCIHPAVAFIARSILLINEGSSLKLPAQEAFASGLLHFESNAYDSPKKKQKHSGTDFSLKSSTPGLQEIYDSFPRKFTLAFLEECSVAFKPPTTENTKNLDHLLVQRLERNQGPSSILRSLIGTLGVEKDPKQKTEKKSKKGDQSDEGSDEDVEMLGNSEVSSRLGLRPIRLDISHPEFWKKKKQGSPVAPSLLYVAKYYQDPIVVLRREKKREAKMKDLEAAEDVDTYLEKETLKMFDGLNDSGSDSESDEEKSEAGKSENEESENEESENDEESEAEEKSEESETEEKSEAEMSEDENLQEEESDEDL